MNAETQQAVDDAVRRVGERDRATLQRCEDLARSWQAQARNAGAVEFSRVWIACAEQLVETLAGPAAPKPPEQPPTAPVLPTEQPVVPRPRWRSRFALALGGTR